MLVLTQINIAIPLVRFLFLYILLTICLLTGYKPTVNCWKSVQPTFNEWFSREVSNFVPLDGVFIVIFFKIIIYNIKTVIRFSLCDIQNNQLCKVFLSVIILDLDYSCYQKNLIQ